MPTYHSASGSVAEDLFIELFSETFGAEKAGYLYSQYHFYDIYQNSRYADFVLENGARRVAIEIDDETSHNKNLVASNKFYDDLLYTAGQFVRCRSSQKPSRTNFEFSSAAIRNSRRLKTIFPNSAAKHWTVRTSN